jgi:hypothetical protein
VGHLGQCVFDSPLGFGIWRQHAGPSQGVAYQPSFEWRQRNGADEIQRWEFEPQKNAVVPEHLLTHDSATSPLVPDQLSNHTAQECGAPTNLLGGGFPEQIEKSIARIEAGRKHQYAEQGV